jgi:CheY-like chemotaxis protein
MDPTVLVADADPLAARYLARQLDRAGFDVVAVSRADAAWYLLHQTQPSLLVLNYRWQGMDPLAFLERIRADEQLSDLPVIVLVPADAELGDDARVLQTLSATVVRQPYSPRRLAVRAFEAVHAASWSNRPAEIAALA